MKHAYLIIAHNEVYILEKLLKLIDNEKNDIFIHIDKKVKNFNFEKFKNLVEKSNIYFVPRIKVYWSSCSQIKCELNMLEYATKKGKYSYYHLISGVDLPLKSQSEIHEFFKKNKTKEFINFISYDIDGITLEKVKYYHLFRKSIRSKNKIAFYMSNFFYKICIKIQKILKIDRTKGKKYMFGSNWFSITDDLARFVVQNKDNILKEYKCTNCADEIFLQTLVYNSKFKKNLYKDNGNLRAIDWKRGNPYTYKEEDFNELMNSGMLFARKFSTNIDKKIVDKIYEKLR